MLFLVASKHPAAKFSLPYNLHPLDLVITLAAFLLYYIVLAHHGKEIDSASRVAAHPSNVHKNELEVPHAIEVDAETYKDTIDNRYPTDPDDLPELYIDDDDDDDEPGWLAEKNRLFWAASSTREKFYFTLGALTLYFANSWPLADLADKYSILAHLMQHLYIALIAVPLMLLGTPRWVFGRLTKPRLLDWTLSKVTRSFVATVIFSFTMVLTMLPPIVSAEASSWLFHDFVHLWIGLAAAIMWIPALKLLPGTRQLTTAGRIAYLFTQSLLPNVPAIVLIFSRHSFYPMYAKTAAAIGISAVADQQLAGAVGKIFSLLVFWGAAVGILLRANRDEELGVDPDLITWDDVEREFERTSKKVTPEN